MRHPNIKKNKKTKVKLTNKNLASLLLESVQEAVGYSRGEISLDSVKLEHLECCEAEQTCSRNQCSKKL